MKILKKAYYMILQRACPLMYAKTIGLIIASDVKLIDKTQWGTEPWLISIGSKTAISNNVKFTNHDGGECDKRMEQYKRVLKFGESI